MSTRIPNPPHCERAADAWPQRGQSLPSADSLWQRATGEAVTEHRSSWVRRVPDPSGDVFVKTYEYVSWASRLRDFGKRTGPWGTPRVVREFDALVWLRQHGFDAPTPLAALVWRRWGFVRRATLVTEAFPGTAAAQLLPTLPTAERIEAARAIGTTVGRLHRLGWRDRNLDLRNLLLAAGHDGWRVAKIDSPRFVLVRPGRDDDRLACADWLRLAPQLAALGLAEAARGAARS